MKVAIPEKCTLDLGGGTPLQKYVSIVFGRKANPLPENEYGEVHHIVPRSCGGLDEDANLVRLTAEEHYWCHYLLPEIYSTGWQHDKVVFAWNMMRCRMRTNNPTEYGELRRECSKARQRFWANPENRRKAGEASKKGHRTRWTPEARRANSEKQKAIWTPERREENRKREKQRMEIDGNREAARMNAELAKEVAKAFWTPERREAWRQLALKKSKEMKDKCKADGTKAPTIEISKSASKTPVQLCLWGLAW